VDTPHREWAKAEGLQYAELVEIWQDDGNLPGKIARTRRRFAARENFGENWVRSWSSEPRKTLLRRLRLIGQRLERKNSKR
jgi:hypothetical protein